MRTAVLQHNKCYLINWLIKYWTVKVIIKLRVELGEIKSKTLKLWRRWRWGRGLTKRVGRDPPLWNRSQQGFGIKFWYGSNDGLKSNESCSTPLFHISADQVEGGPGILSAFPLQPLLWKNQEMRQLCICIYSAQNTRVENKEFQLNVQHVVFLLPFSVKICLHLAWNLSGYIIHLFFLSAVFEIKRGLFSFQIV